MFQPTLYRAVTLLLALFLSAAAFAQSDNPVISIQGTLKDANGNTIADGPQNLVFTLYDLSGRVHFSDELPVGGSLYLPNLAAGTYTYTIRHTAGAVAGRLVVN